VANRCQRSNVLQQYCPGLLRTLHIHPPPTTRKSRASSLTNATVQIGRTLHIHVQVHTNWTITKNGTIDHSRVVETGQIYFDEQLTEELMAVEPYASHTQIDRVVNDDDGVFLQQVQCKLLPSHYGALKLSADIFRQRAP
jgi:hypothetical protein